MLARSRQANPGVQTEGLRARVPVRKFSFPAADVGVGEEVRAQWKGFGYKGKLYHGIIEAMNDDGSFHVRFDDGDVDTECPAKHITRENGAAVPRVHGGCFTLCNIARCTVQCASVN